MRLVVYTAITADRDCLKERQATTGADFVAFCDRAVASDVWQVRPACDLFRDPVRNAKIHKVLPHLFFADYDYSLWLDGAVELTEPAPSLVERYLGEHHDVVFGCHGVHRSLADEVASCLREVRDDPALIAAQMATCGPLSEELELPLACVTLRRHNEAVAHFNAIWWAEICRWSRRDMLSVLPALRASGVRWGCFPRSPELAHDPTRRTLGSPHFQWYPHGSDVALPTEVPMDQPGAAPEAAWSGERLHFLEVVSGTREAYALDLERELAARTHWAREAERYAHSLEAELARLTRHLEEVRREGARASAEAERYAHSLEAELARLTQHLEDVRREGACASAAAER
jgi:hypothetical protein